MEEAEGPPRGRAGFGRGGARFDRDWTKGSIIGNLLSLAWPMMIGGSINMLGPTIDMIWVGKLGAASIAGVGVSGMIVMMVDSLKMGLMTGLRAIVARSIGADDYETANHAAQQTFIISAAYSLIVATVGIIFAEPILILMGLEPDVVSEGTAYMRIMFVGRIPMSLWMMCEAMMQASGDAITPMKTTIAFRLFQPLFARKLPNPRMPARGRKMMTKERVVATTARPISLVPSEAACAAGIFFSSMFRKTFSSTTMLSSTRMPMLSASASRVMTFRLKPASRWMPNSRRRSRPGGPRVGGAADPARPRRS